MSSKHRVWILTIAQITLTACNILIPLLTSASRLVIGLLTFTAWTITNILSYIQNLTSVLSLPLGSPPLPSSPQPSSLTFRQGFVILWKCFVKLPWRSIGKSIRTLLTVIVGTILITYTGLIYPLYIYQPYYQSSCTPYPAWNLQSVLSDNQPINAHHQGPECIGISDGGFRLDASQNSVPGIPNIDMIQLAHTYRENSDHQKPESDWASTKGHDDAEPLIYAQDANILSEGQNYLDIVVVTMLSGKYSSINLGRNELRGYYTALEDYNGSSTNGIPVRFLIANIGDEAHYASQIEQQIKALAGEDTHLIGILGWPTSGSNQIVNIIHDLIDTGLPIISPTASADELSQQNPYFFRMVPPNQVQAESAVKLVENVFTQTHPDTINPQTQRIKDGQKIKVAIFKRDSAPYSLSLSQDFIDAASSLAPEIDFLPEKTYNPNADRNQYEKQLQSEVDVTVDQSNPDIIYLAGYSDDAQIILNELQKKDPDPSPHIKVVGGDGVSYVKNYPHSNYPASASNRLYYVSFTPPPLDCTKHQDDFYSYYFADFNICPTSEAMLAHDAALTIFSAISKLHNPDTSTQKGIITARNSVWNQLKGINKFHPLSKTDQTDKTIVTGKNGTVTFQNGDRVDPIIEFFYLIPDSDGEIEEKPFL